MKMKFLSRSLSSLSIFSLVLFFSCGDDGGGADPRKGQLQKLSKQWSIVSADLDNSAANETTGFTNFKLTIGGTFNSSNPEGPYTYTVSGSRPTPSPWPGEDEGHGGEWTFVGDPVGDSGLILRDDGIGMEYEINGSELTLTFNFTGTGYEGARTAEVNGNWTFVFN